MRFEMSTLDIELYGRGATYCCINGKRVNSWMIYYYDDVGFVEK